MVTRLRRAGDSPRSALFALIAVAGLLLAFALVSPGRPAGDGPEYIALARAVVNGGGEAFATAWHFWMYPAMAAPFVRLASAAGWQETVGFAALNAVLLLLAFRVVARSLNLVAAVLIAVGPILWWTNKPHTETFTYALLSIALALRDSPWAMVAVGLAATQNPPIAVLLPLLLADWWARRRVVPAGRTSVPASMWLGVGAGVLLAWLPAAYYELTRGVVNPLVATGQQQAPALREALAVVCDPNLGVAFGYPLLPILVLASAVVIIRRDGLKILVREAWLPAVTAAVFLWTFAHVTNFNHGATPGMSRYALWLIPLAIPLLRAAFPSSAPGSSRLLLTLTIASVIWSLAFFRPSLPEGLGRPSTVAGFVWHRFPALDNPLPEVFAERNSGMETTALPVAEPGCAKVLLMGDGGDGGMWPLPCPPAPIPAECRQRETLCYANRSNDGYRYVRIRPRAYHAFRLANDTWPAGAEAFAQRLFSDEQWRDARIVRAGQAGAMLRAVHAARRGHALQGTDRLFVCVVQPREGAALDLRIPARLQGQVIDLRGAYTLGDWELLPLPGVQSVAVPPASDLVAFIGRGATH